MQKLTPLEYEPTGTETFELDFMGRGENAIDSSRRAGRRDGACFGNDCEFGAREKEEHRVRSARDFEFVLGIGEDLW